MPSRVHELTDLPTARRVLRASYSTTSVTSHEANPGLWIEQQPIGRVSLDHVASSTDVTVVQPSSDVLYIGRVRRGVGVFDRPDGRTAYRAGDVFLSGHPSHGFTVDACSLDVEVACVPQAVLSEVDPPGRGGSGTRVLGCEPVSSATASHWCRTYDLVLESVATLTEDPSPLLVGSLERLLAATALLTFANSSDPGDSSGDRLDAHPASLRRAKAYIDSHAQADLTVVDVAEHARVTPRALQLAFRRHLGTTPMRYVRQVRLEHARADLLAADSARTTVTAVAHRWGFFNTGRFAELYRAAFGETPSRALHRR